MTFPFHRVHEFDKKQLGCVDIDHSKPGLLSVRTMFSNGKQLDGDNFRASITMKDPSGVVIAAVDHKAGVNASFGGSANERVLTSDVALSEGKINSISLVEVRFSHEDRIDDQKFWEEVKKITETVWEAYQSHE